MNDDISRLCRLVADPEVQNVQTDGGFMKLLEMRDLLTVLMPRLAFTNDQWQLVPKEPTKEMLRASRTATDTAKSIEACDRAIYAAMLAAAPLYGETE